MAKTWHLDVQGYYRVEYLRATGSGSEWRGVHESYYRPGRAETLAYCRQQYPNNEWRIVPPPPATVVSV